MHEEAVRLWLHGSNIHLVLMLCRVREQQGAWAARWHEDGGSSDGQGGAYLLRQ